MKRFLNPLLLAILLIAGWTGTAKAQSYDISWFTIDCGGGTSVLGDFEVQGTIGQTDAATLTGGGFELAGGFWTLDETPSCGTSDYNGDGDFGTDADIEDFFACLGGTCCPLCPGSDFNTDGDFGTDADIESFFRVLGGGPC